MFQHLLGFKLKHRKIKVQFAVLPWLDNASLKQAIYLQSTAETTIRRFCNFIEHGTRFISNNKKLSSGK